MSYKSFDEIAPLSETSYNVKDQLDLINRGFVTVYSITFDRDEYFYNNLVVKSVDFGVVNYGSSSIEMQFKIVGLPAPKNTEVWLLGAIEENYETNQNDHLHVFRYLDDAKDFIKNTKGEYYPINLFNDIISDNNFSKDELINLIMDNNQWGLFLTKINLP